MIATGSAGMIRVFVSDIDGCLGEPYQSYDLDTLRVLRERIREHPNAPAFSLCSGRAYAYVESVSQLMDVRAPVLFEGGGGLFDPVAARVEWHPEFTQEVEAALEEVGSWLRRDALAGTALMFDHGKRTQRGIVGADGEAIRRLVPEVQSFVSDLQAGLCVFSTPVSIDVLPEAMTKAAAMRWLAERLEIDLGEMAYIGDSEGDLPALQIVGRSFAPANAAPEVRAEVEVVTQGAVASGTLEAYDACIELNVAASAA